MGDELRDIAGGHVKIPMIKLWLLMREILIGLARVQGLKHIFILTGNTVTMKGWRRLGRMRVNLMTG